MEFKEGADGKEEPPLQHKANCSNSSEYLNGLLLLHDCHILLKEQIPFTAKTENKRYDSIEE
jgi:hypothetical protein